MPPLPSAPKDAVQRQPFGPTSSMIPWSSAYIASSVASARGTATGREAGSATGGLNAPRDVGHLTTGRLAVTDPAVMAWAAVP